MIQGIQDRTHTAIASMESGTGTVEQGVATTHQPANPSSASSESPNRLIE